MDYFAGLDVSVKETSVCIVDDAGIRLSAWTCRHVDGEAARKIVPPRLRIPMMEGPWCRVRREARARERHPH